jgi:hypothetical protein
MMRGMRVSGEGAGRGLVRLFQGVGAAAGWYVSFMFSVTGFIAWNQSTANTRYAYAIVIFFTALQLWVNHQNRESPNYGLAVSGIVSYGYGIITNVMGILALGGTSLAVAWDTKAWWQIALALCLGIPLEIGPESLLMKAMFPDSRNMVSDAAVGIWKLVQDLFTGGGGGSAYTPYRPSVDDLTTSVRPHPSRNPSNPRWNNTPTTSVRPAANPMPMDEESDNSGSDDIYHMLGGRR